jgi:hypothetical protein
VENFDPEKVKVNSLDQELPPSVVRTNVGVLVSAPPSPTHVAGPVHVIWRIPAATAAGIVPHVLPFVVTSVAGPPFVSAGAAHCVEDQQPRATARPPAGSVAVRQVAPPVDEYTIRSGAGTATPGPVMNKPGGERTPDVTQTEADGHAMLLDPAKGTPAATVRSTLLQLVPPSVVRSADTPSRTVDRVARATHTLADGQVTAPYRSESPPGSGSLFQLPPLSVVTRASGLPAERLPPTMTHLVADIQATPVAMSSGNFSAFQALAPSVVIAAVSPSTVTARHSELDGQTTSGPSTPAIIAVVQIRPPLEVTMDSSWPKVSE